MPTVKIELLTGRDKPTLIKIKNLVMNSVVESLQLSPNDTNIRVIEYQPDLFQMKPPYKILIEISMFIGRTRETKKKLYRTIIDKLESAGLIDKENVLITLNEQSLENWGIRGGIPADELDLGFKVDI
jgi:phenylpyruvate tautomerase PptA (4-oxalocrotonate tautomerase family)